MFYPTVCIFPSDKLPSLSTPLWHLHRVYFDFLCFFSLPNLIKKIDDVLTLITSFEVSFRALRNRTKGSQDMTHSTLVKMRYFSRDFSKNSSEVIYGKRATCFVGHACARARGFKK